MDSPRQQSRPTRSPLVVQGASVLLASVLLLTASRLGNANPHARTHQESSEKTMTALATTDLATFREYDAIKNTLHLYIDNAGPSNGAAMRPAFFDHARIVGSVEGNFYNMTADEFEGVIDADAESPEIEYHISWIDYSGDAGAAKVEFLNWGGHRFTDFFVLYKHEGEWKISGKVYDSHSKS